TNRIRIVVMKSRRK
ncbi:hypothetical protein V3C99_012958, partial [Haemonchus contortus]